LLKFLPVTTAAMLANFAYYKEKIAAKI